MMRTYSSSSRRVPRLVLSSLALVALVQVGCSTPSGEYGGVYYEDNSPGPKGGPVVKSEQVGTGIGPWGGIYNYEEVNFGPSS